MNFKSRTLLAVTGLSPQIVTETLFAIMKQYGEEALPNRVKILTTEEGANRARLTLLDKYSGKFHAFLREFSLEGKVLFIEQDIHLISDAKGSVLDDIVTPEDNAAAANCITNLMRQLTQDSESQLHVSIAGGRKTMGFYLGYAFSLFARPQDVLSHVLVASPFESHPEFFYPPTNGLVLYTQDKKPIHTDDAKIWLAEIPVVKLRHGVSAQHLQKEVNYTDVVHEVEQSFNPARVVIDIAKKKITCGGVEVKLIKFHLIWFAHLCLSKMQHKSVVLGPDFYHEILKTGLLFYPGVGEAAEILQSFNPEHKGFDEFNLPKRIRSENVKIIRKIEKKLPVAYPNYKINNQGDKVNTEFFIGIEPINITCTASVSFKPE